jgi:hypothetical protein
MAGGGGTTRCPNIGLQRYRGPSTAWADTVKLNGHVICWQFIPIAGESTKKPA